MESQNITFPRLGYSLAEAEVLTGLSRATLYRLLKRGELQTVKRGGRRLVPSRELEKLCSLEQAGSA
jgi:excisionase family DNA binding protein